MKEDKETKRRKSRYADWDVLERELQEIIEREYLDDDGTVIKRGGEYPSQLTLSRMGRGDLLGAIRQHHGGCNAVREALGFKATPKPPGYWKDFRTVERELREVVSREYRDNDGNVVKAAGETPTQRILNKIGRDDLNNAIQKYHGGMSAVKSTLGLDLATRPRGYWKDFSNIERELREIIDNEYRDKHGNLIKNAGEFPPFVVLRKCGGYGLTQGAMAYHGGLRAVRERLGFATSKKPDGYWQNRENVIRELRAIIKRELRNKKGEIVKAAGRFPNYKHLALAGRADLYAGVRIHYKSIASAREAMGFEPVRGDRGFWRDYANVERELRNIAESEHRDRDGKIIKHAGDFPTGGVLGTMGLASLARAVVRYHGGLLKIKAALGYASSERPRGYFRDFRNLKKSLEAIIDREYRNEEGELIKSRNEFPTQRALKEMELADLVHAIKKHHGGFTAVARAMDFAASRRPMGYWRDFRNVERELLRIMDMEYRDEDGRLIRARGALPIHKELQDRGPHGLLQAIYKYHGGRSAVFHRMDIPPKSWSDYSRSFPNVKEKLFGIARTEYRDTDGHVIKGAGEFPTESFLERTGQWGLLDAIKQHHGGWALVEDRLKALFLRPRGFWKNIENVEQRIRDIMSRECRAEDGRLLRARGLFPGLNELRKHGLDGMIHAIFQHHGGYTMVRAMMGVAPSPGQRGFWKDFKAVQRELVEIIGNEFKDERGSIVKAAGVYPTYSELVRLRRTDLLSAMQLYHGGHRAVKAKMGFSPDMPEETATEFVNKLRTVEGAEEIARCPDLSAADKADILVAQNRDVFLSPAYVEYALRKLEEMPSFAPYVEGEPWRRDSYRTHEHLDVLVQRHPDLFARRELFALVVRKLENVYFQRFQENPHETLAELKKLKQQGGLLSKLYAAADRNLRKMQALRVPGAIKRIKNPHLFEGCGLERTVPFPSLHQKRGILRILEQRRVLIADEMGTGKTAQAILGKLLLGERLGKRVRTLVICPSSVISWWREKIDEYCENIRARDVVILSSGGWKRGAMERARDGAEFVLINYELLARRSGAGRPSLVGELADLGFDYVVVDEVHNAKNMNANRADAIQRITERTPYVALLSGTPIPNRLRDIGMTMSLLEPERYPTAKHFRVAYGNNPRLIRDALINGRMLRVRSKDVFELPELRFREETVRLEPEQRDGYLDICRDRALSIYAKFALLRLILLDPNTVPRYVTRRPMPSPKYEALDRILEDKVGAGEKVVVFTCFRRGITGKLAKRYERFNATLIDGDIDPHPRVCRESQREVVRREFQFGDSQVLIATVGTMSEGVDLSSASSVVFLDKPFTSTGRDQAVKRVHRLGQTRPVEVVSLIATDPKIDEEIRDKETGDHGTLDEAIERLIEKKAELIEQVVDGARLSQEEKKLMADQEILGRVLYRISDGRNAS